MIREIEERANGVVVVEQSAERWTVVLREGWGRAPMILTSRDTKEEADAVCAALRRSLRRFAVGVSTDATRRLEEASEAADARDEQIHRIGSIAAIR